MRHWKGVAVCSALVIIGSAAGIGITTAAGGDQRRVAVIGDSISTGYGSSKSWTKIIDEHYESNGNDLKVWAVDGATTLRWIQEYPQRMDDLASYAPNEVAIILGANSYVIGRGTVDEEDHLMRLTRRIKQMVPDAVVVYVHEYDICAYGLDCVAYASSPACDIPGNCANEPKPSPRWDDYGDMLRRMTGDDGSHYIDMNEFPPTRAMIGADKVHTNDQGQAYLAINMEKRL